MTKAPDIQKPDTLYSEAQGKLQPFTFNQAVAEVFPDMINRSVPSYSLIVEGIGKIAQNRLLPDCLVYDLGCSTGNVSLSIAKHCQSQSIQIHGVDNSEPMLVRCQQHINSYNYAANITLFHADIAEISLDTCDLVVMNFTLQFIPQKQREAIITRIFNALRPGGALIVSEKISAPTPVLDQQLIELHHQFKRENGYSDLEISQKRTALENVMITDTLGTHIKRLQKAGFTDVSTWFQHFNFASILAVKS